MSGVGVCQWNPEAALWLLDALTDEVLAGENFIGHTVADDMRAKAHSAAAFAYWKEWTHEGNETLQKQIVKNRESFKQLAAEIVEYATKVTRAVQSNPQFSATGRSSAAGPLDPQVEKWVRDIDDLTA